MKLEIKSLLIGVIIGFGSIILTLVSQNLMKLEDMFTMKPMDIQ